MALSEHQVRDVERKPAVWADITSLAAFLKLPDEKPAREFMDGMVSRKVSPKARHGGFQFELGRLLYDSSDSSRPIRIFTEARGNLRRSVVRSPTYQCSVASGCKRIQMAPWRTTCSSRRTSRWKSTRRAR